MSGYAWVTLATNNAYSLGALVLAHSLKKEKTAHKLAVLITPAVSQPMREQLQTVFDVVKVVDVLDSKDEAHLALMKRPDLGITFTKIHCWRLVEFEKCVFLDADTLVVRNCDELFEREEFSAAPDVSWPDCFNSGVFVYRPSEETFNKLLQFAVENRSFDGGDQGLLNQYFSDWATEDIKKHLPFVYNLTSIAAYSYIPAFKHYGAETRIVHFIGTGKPWLQQLDAATKTVTPTSGSEHLAPLLQQWWNLFCEKVHPNLDKNLESSNDGMPHSPVEACSNSLPIALIDESQTPRLIESCTTYREKNDFRQCNLPYQPFDVKGSSGELLNVEFLLASVVPPTATEVSLDEQQRLKEDKIKEKDEEVWREEKEESKSKEEQKPENYIHTYQGNDVYQISYTTHEPEKTEEEKKESEKEEENLQQKEELQNQQEPPPPKDPFDYNSFFPDEICINNYLERNLETYQLFENHHQQNHQSNNETNISIHEDDHEPSIPPPLPRFLTMPEDDRRQSGNMEMETCKHGPTQSVEEYHHSKTEFPPNNILSEKENCPQEKPNLQRELSREFQAESFVEKRELTKSKSMPYLPCDVINTEPLLPPTQSIWKSQPDINVDLNKKYSMPKLKPILPRQNSKSIPSSIPKITQYTEFLMSAEYKDPVDLPKDKVGFVEMHIHKEGKLRRSKSDVDIRSKFGPLPYVLSPEVEKPIIPKKIPFRHLDNELYDLTQCKRQMGNKPKSKDADEKKENLRLLPVLKPNVPARYKKSTLIKKRKSKELSPGGGGKEKISRKESKLIRERRREPKVMVRNASTKTNSNDVDEILNRLREFSKNYQHFLGPPPESKKKLIKCKNTSVQASDQNDSECKMSESFETMKTPTRTMSKETQTPKKGSQESDFEGSEFQKFRKYIKGQKEASQMGLINIQDIVSKSNKVEREITKSHIPEDKQNRFENGSDCFTEILNRAQVRGENTKLGEESHSLKAQGGPVLLRKEYSTCQSHFAHTENESNNESSDTLDSLQSVMKCCNSSSSKFESATYSAVAFPSNLALQSLSDKDETKNTEDKANSKFKLFTVGSPSKGEITPLCSKEQREELPNETSFAVLKKCQGISNGIQRASVTSLQTVAEREQGAFAASKKSKDFSEENEAIKVSDVLSRTNYKKSDDGTESELCQNDDSSMTSSGQEANLTLSEANFTIKDSNEVPESELLSENHVSLPLKKGKLKRDDITKVPEDGLEISNGKCGDDSNGTLSAKVVTKNLAPVVSSPGTSEKNQNGRIVPNGNVNKNEVFEKRELQPNNIKSQKATDIIKVSSTSLNATENTGSEESKKPNDILCVSDFDTPRSSRVLLPSAKPTASLLAEEKVKTVTSEGPLTSASPTSPLSTFQKVLKSRKSPKKISVRDLSNSQISENRFEILSSNSPDGTVRFESKKTSDKKSWKKTPPLPSPVSGNAQLENLEDTKSLSGIAGAIAQLSLEAGSPQNPESTATSTAQQEYLRRQNWETGNVDYMGKDSFENIWSKICQTIEAKELEETKNSTIKTEGEKPEEAPPATCPAFLPSILQKCPEYIETLPGEPAGEPVEDDEIIFSKSENKSSLMNIVEEEEVGTESLGCSVPAVVKGGVKLSDILQSGGSVSAEIHSGTPLATKKPQEMIKTEATKTYVGKEKEQTVNVIPAEKSNNLLETLATSSTAAKPADSKPQPTAAPADPKSQPTAAPADPKSQPTAAPADSKPQPTAAPADSKPQPSAAPADSKPQPSAAPADSKPQPSAAPADSKPQPTAAPAVSKPQPSAAPADSKPQPSAAPADSKPQPTAAPADSKPQPTAAPADSKSQPTAAPADLKLQSVGAQSQKSQSEIEKPECQVVAICHPLVPLPEIPSPDVQKQPETPAKDEKSDAKLKEKEDCKTVALQSPGVFPKAPHTEKNKKKSKRNKSKGKPEAELEPIPLPAPDSPTVAPLQETPSQTSGSDFPNNEGKQKKGVFTKILEMVGVAPKEKNGNEISKSVFYDVEKGAPSEQPQEVTEKQELNERDKPSMVATKPTVGDVQSKEIEQEFSVDSQTTKEFPQPQPEAKITDFGTTEKEPETKEPSEAQEKNLVTKSEAIEKQKETEKPNSLGVKEISQGNQERLGQRLLEKPARSSSPKELKQPTDSTQTRKRKSPSPKLTMPQMPPETEVTTPTSPPQPSEDPPRRNSALLIVDDSILETPPVPEPFREGIDETVKGKVSTEIDDIIGKAKSEVESLLQGRRSVEKELGESTDLINTMKLMMGEEQPTMVALEGVEELKVTSEEERKRHRGPKSSKLSDQILKAIPPPRRKAISEASASTSGIPKAPAAPEQKPSSGESKAKASKPSSIPVPPPRSRGKPTQPAPSKGKGKK